MNQNVNLDTPNRDGKKFFKTKIVRDFLKEGIFKRFSRYNSKGAFFLKNLTELFVFSKKTSLGIINLRLVFRER